MKSVYKIFKYCNFNVLTFIVFAYNMIIEVLVSFDRFVRCTCLKKSEEINNKRGTGVFPFFAFLGK